MEDFLAVQAEAEQYRLVVESAPSALIMVDRDGKIILVNALAEKLFGYSREELLGGGIETLVPPRFRRVHADYLAGFLSAPQTRAMGAGRDLYGLRKDGAEVPIEIGLNAIKTAKGAFVLAAIVDITERKRSDERLRLVIETAPNAMIMVAKDGKIVFANARAAALFGYRREEFLGEKIEILVPHRFLADHPGHREGFFKNPKTRAMGAGRDLFGLRKDGREVPIEIGLNPIETQEGLFILASIIDITERRRLDEMILASLKEKETLLKEVHHRVKNNLQIVSSLLALQAGHISDKQANAVFTESQNRIKSIARIHEMLYRSPSLSRIDFGEYVGDLLAELMISFSGGTNISITADVRHIFMDAEKAVYYGLIITELVSNSIKHAFPASTEGEICVTMRQSESQLTLEIRDTGVGFPKGRDSRKSASLGLKLVDTFARQLGAAVEHVDGPGTLWRLTSPLTA